MREETDVGSALPAAVTARDLWTSAAAPGVFGAWECRLPAQALSWTDGVYDLFGLARGSTLSRSMTLEHYREDSRREMERLRSEAIRTGRGFALDCRIRTPRGEDRWMRLLVGVGRENGRVTRIFGSKQDVTAEKTMWSGLSAAARGEPQTALQGSSGLAQRLREAVRGERTAQADLALAIVDVDGDGKLEERFGHAAASEALRCMNARLARLFPDALLMETIGPGCFALLLHLPGGQRTLAPTLDGAQTLLARPISHGSQTVVPVMAIGAALSNASHRDDPGKFVAEAEAALLAAKSAGPGRCRIFGGVVTLPVPAGAARH